MKNKVLYLIVLLSIVLSISSLEAVIKGDKKMNQKICVVYSSKTGSTAEIAIFIKNTLANHGIESDVKKASEQVNLNAYKAVIIGSPIYMGRWNKEASQFIEIHQNELKKIPVAYFAVGMSFDKTDAKNLETIKKYLEKERQMVKPISEGHFLGRMDFKKLSFFQRIVSKIVGAKEEDKRNWNAIKQWTESFIDAI